MKGTRMGFYKWDRPSRGGCIVNVFESCLLRWSNKGKSRTRTSCASSSVQKDPGSYENASLVLSQMATSRFFTAAGKIFLMTSIIC